MKKIHVLLLALLAIIQVSMTSCNNVTANHEGVLQKNFGRNGKQDFRTQTGAAGFLWWGEELYQVPMFEQNADPTKMDILTGDNSIFGVDPTYTYMAIRGRGIDIIFNFRHVGVNEPDKMMDNIEVNSLNRLVINAYREEARNFTTDSIMRNMNKFEANVQARLRKEFFDKGFELKELTSGLLPPQSMIKAIENRNNAKIIAEQTLNELQTAKNQLEKARIEAERDRVKSAGLTKEILASQYIEAIRNTQNKVIITDGKAPIILNQ